MCDSMKDCIKKEAASGIDSEVRSEASSEVSSLESVEDLTGMPEDASVDAASGEAAPELEDMFRSYLLGLLKDLSKMAIRRPSDFYAKIWPEPSNPADLTKGMHYIPKVYWKDGPVVMNYEGRSVPDLNGDEVLMSAENLPPTQMVYLAFDLKECSFICDTPEHELYFKQNVSYGLSGWRIVSNVPGVFDHAHWPQGSWTHKCFTGTVPTTRLRVPLRTASNTESGNVFTGLDAACTTRSWFGLRVNGRDINSAPLVSVKRTEDMFYIHAPAFMAKAFKQRGLGYLLFGENGVSHYLLWSTCRGYPEFMMLQSRINNEMMSNISGTGDISRFYTLLETFFTHSTGVYGLDLDCKNPNGFSLLSADSRNGYLARYVFEILKFFDTWKIYRKRGDTAWKTYRYTYRHWPVKKKNKPGYRLISAPIGSFKKVTADVHNVLSQAFKRSSSSKGVYSYLPETDYVKKLAKAKLSTERVGRWCLEIDFKDYFTNITPRLLSLVIEKARAYDPDLYDSILEAAVKLLGYVNVTSRASVRDFAYDNYGKPVGWFARYRSKILARAFTTVLPLWKKNLNGFDLDKLDGSEAEHSVERLTSQYKTEIVHEHNFHDVRRFHEQQFGSSPFLQRGVPQGACFSGDVANIVSSALAGMFVTFIKSILKDMSWTPDTSVFKEPKITPVIYSDNLYIFFDASDNIHGMFMRLFDLNVADPGRFETFLGSSKNNMKYGFTQDEGYELARDLRKLVSFDKIRMIDRTRIDVKMLGIIIDKDGNVRLSREARRRLNQRIIHAAEDGWTQADVGKRVWFDNVTEFTGGAYSRGLLSEKYPDKFSFAIPKKRRGNAESVAPHRKKRRRKTTRHEVPGVDPVAAAAAAAGLNGSDDLGVSGGTLNS